VGRCGLRPTIPNAIAIEATHDTPTMGYRFSLPQSLNFWKTGFRDSISARCLSASSL